MSSPSRFNGFWKPYSIMGKVENLKLDEQLRLLEELAGLVHQGITSKPKRSIMELDGLENGIWQAIDAQEYVNRERVKYRTLNFIT